MKGQKEYGQEKKITFFEQLQEFCLDFQTEVSYLKKKTENKPGCEPKSYDKGIKALKSQLDDVKILMEDTRGKLAAVQQFSYFAETTKDLINAQKEDVQAIENYLVRYGYKPPSSVDVKTVNETQPPNIEYGYKPPSSVDVKIVNETQPPNIEPEKDTMKTLEEMVSPELSEVGRSVLQGKDVHFKTPLRGASDKPIAIVIEQVSKTPVQSKPRDFTPTPCMSSRKRLVEWLARVEAARSGETPIYRKDLKGSSSSNDGSPTFPSTEQRKVLQIASERITPDEPVLSSITTALMKEEPFITPEEPLLSEVSSLFVRRLNEVIDKTTPEEPMLMSQNRGHSRTQEPSTDYPYQSFPSTPQSPQLSDITKKVLNVKYLKFTNDEQDSESKGGLKYSERYVDNEQNLTDDDPESPQLSDVTRKTLNLKY